MKILFFVLHSLIMSFLILSQIDLPVRSDQIELTSIGDFGIVRKARPTVPEHLHTGIDIMRPGNEYEHEPILSINKGVVISKREDGPYAQLIIEHQTNKQTYWTVYEHIAGIRVELGDEVYPEQVIARFFNKEELNKYGWQFDHFHFEVLKKRPLKMSPSGKNPYRHFRSYTLQCFTEDDLLDKFYDPIYFLSSN